MPNKARIPVRDSSAENSSVNLNLADSVTSATADALLAGFVTAVRNDDIINGLFGDAQLTFSYATAEAGPIAPGAERELKWYFQYRDVQQYLDPGTDTVPNSAYNKLFGLTIPTADSSVKPIGSDLLPLANAPETVAWLNANQKSPTGGSASVQLIRLVGRNI